MKYILSIFLLISFASTAQVKVGADGAIHATGAYPSAVERELKGYVLSVKGLAERNAIPANFRDTGMIILVRDSSYLYSLVGGIANSNWQLFSSAGSISGGDTTIFDVVVDSTGQAARRVLFSRGDNRISSDPVFLYDSIHNKLSLNTTNFSRGGNSTKLYVNGNTWFDGNQINRGNLTVTGTATISTTASGTAGTDSLLVQSNGLIKKISPTYYGTGAGSVTNVTGSGNISSSGGTTPNITFTGVLPIANGGTNNGSLSVTSQNLMITDGSKIIGLAKGTNGQRLNIVSGNLTWTDTSAGGGGGSLNNVYAPIIKSGDTISTRYNLLHYGGDTARRSYVVTTTNGSTTVGCSDCNFTSNNANNTILINGAGSAGGVLRTTISSVSNSTTIIVANAASATTSSDTTIYGKDNCPALQAAINACAQGGGGKVTAPLGTYLFSGALSGGAINSQILIPLDTGGASINKVVISIEGETVYGGSASSYSLQFPGKVQTRGTIFYSTISGSGTAPAFIATGPTRNRNDLSLSNLGIMVYTNHGATAVSVTPINASNIQKTDVYRCTISPDIELTRSTSPASTEIAGIVIGGIDDNGENMITETEIVGFKHGLIAGEHTRLNGNLIFGNINGLTIPAANHVISGSSQIFACVNEIYAPSYTLFGNVAGNSNLDLLNESEFDTTASVVGTGWYKSVLNVSDSGGRIRGNLRINLYDNGVVNATSPHVYGVDSSKLSISTFSNPYAFQNLRNVFRVPQIFYPASNDDAIRIRNSADSVSLGKVRSSSSGLFSTNDFYTNNYNSGGTVFSNANSGGYFKFATNSSTPQVYIDASGNVGIATTSTTANQKLLINGNATISGIHYGDLTVGGAASTAHTIWVKSYDNGASVGAFRMTSGGTLQFGDFTSAGMSVAEFYCNGKWLTMTSAGVIAMPHYGAGAATFDASGNISSSSDIRLKRQIEPFKTGIEAIMNIDPISFKWNEKSGNEMKETYVGFSAQNVKANIPNSTGVTSDGYLTLQDRAILATLVNAVKEQQAEIELLKKQIELLKR